MSVACLQCSYWESCRDKTVQFLGWFPELNHQFFSVVGWTMKKNSKYVKSIHLTSAFLCHISACRKTHLYINCEWRRSGTKVKVQKVCGMTYTHFNHFCWIYMYIFLDSFMAACQGLTIHTVQSSFSKTTINTLLVYPAEQLHGHVNFKHIYNTDSYME